VLHGRRFKANILPFPESIVFGRPASGGGGGGGGGEGDETPRSSGGARVPRGRDPPAQHKKNRGRRKR
jgi:hypothetical protein